MKQRKRSNKHRWFLLVLFAGLASWAYANGAPVPLLVFALAVGYSIRRLEE